MFMNYFCAKVYTTSSSNIKNTNIFSIPRDFTQNLAILPWYGLIQSFVFIGRSYFHKNKKYEFACQLTGTEAINNKRKDDAMEKNILLDLECIAFSTIIQYKKSCSGKPKVETGGKYKCLLCMGVARIDGRGK